MRVCRSHLALLLQAFEIEDRAKGRGLKTLKEPGREWRRRDYAAPSDVRASLASLSGADNGA